MTAGSSESTADSGGSSTNTAPATSDACFQNAARVLHFAERETDSRLFEHWTTLAERWMELGTMMGSDDG